MLKTTTADAVAALQEALIALPSELEARNEFFVQWRNRTIESLERIFLDDPTPVRQFKDIEFSPRRLSKDDTRDAQLKLDAFLAGCATARSYLEDTIRRLVSGPDKPAPAEVQGEAQTPELLLDLTPPPEPAPAPVRKSKAKPAPISAPIAPPVPEPESVPAPAPAPEPVRVPPAPKADSSTQLSHAMRDVFVGGSMDSRQLCAPVRSSLSRVLGAWDSGDQDMALVLSAQLLAELTVLARHERFKAAFESVVAKAFDPRSQPGVADAVKSAAPLCLWSLVAAMNEVMKT